MKGSMLPIPLLIFGVLIASMVPFVPLMISGNAQHRVEYSENDMSQLIKSKQKVENYRANMKREMNYSLNNAALILGKEGGGLGTWTEIPDRGQIRQKLADAIFSSKNVDKKIGLESQSRVFMCTTPELERKNFELGEEGRKMTLDLEGKGIRCGEDGVKAMVYMTEAVSYTSQINNYMEIATDSIETAKEAREIIEGKEWEKKSAAGTACGSEEEAQENAKENLREKLREGNIARKAYQDEKDDNGHPEYLAKDHLITRYSFSIDVTSSGKLYHPKTGEEVKCNCEKKNVDDDEELEKVNCETKYGSGVEGSVSKVKMDFRVKDGENQVLSWKGMKKLVFDYDYHYSNP